MTNEERISLLENAQLENCQQHKEIMDMLKPIARTYDGANLMGKWIMALLVFISILLGVFIGWKNVIDIFFRK
jgi:hypothetical protein